MISFLYGFIDIFFDFIFLLVMRTVFFEGTSVQKSTKLTRVLPNLTWLCPNIRELIAIHFATLHMTHDTNKTSSSSSTRAHAHAHAPTHTHAHAHGSGASGIVHTHAHGEEHVHPTSQPQQQDQSHSLEHYLKTSKNFLFQNFDQTYF